ncbi:hypothetical protein KA005_80915, partial [bacterium]|nr:hypothetical protein [bacterium]
MYESRDYSSSYRRFACIFLSSLLVLLILSITQFIPSVFGQERGIQFYIGGEPSIYPGDVRLDYYRYLQLVGLAPFDPLVIQPVSHETKQIIYDSGPWKDHFQGSFAGINSQTARWGIIPVSSSFVYNSAFPYGKNDGAMWAGKGLSSLINLGVYFVAGPLSIQLGPSYYLSQNLDFELVPVSSTGYSCFINPWHLTTIDLPQQFGPKAISR